MRHVSYYVSTEIREANTKHQHSDARRSTLKSQETIQDTQDARDIHTHTRTEYTMLSKAIYFT